MAKAVISFPGSFFKYAFQRKSTLYSCLNVKEHLARNRRDIWSLSDNNGIQTHNHLVCKRTLNHYTKLASLAKWSSVHLQTKWLLVRILLLSLRLHEFTWRFFKTITSIDIKKRTRFYHVTIKDTFLKVFILVLTFSMSVMRVCLFYMC